MAEPSDSPHHLFVLRIWSGPGDPFPVVKRGLIEHVPTGERRYFLDLIEMQAFIAERLATSPGTTVTDDAVR